MCGTTLKLTTTNAGEVSRECNVRTLFFKRKAPLPPPPVLPASNSLGKKAPERKKKKKKKKEKKDEVTFVSR